MDAFHRLAGITSDTTDAHTQPAQPIYPKAPPIPDDTHGPPGQLSQHSSHTSLPIHRQPSQKSARSARSGPHRRRGLSDADATTALPGQRISTAPAPLHLHPTTTTNPTASLAATQGEREGGDDDGSESEFTWGPTHPCFPHPNPHCDRASATYARTRVIRVRRDYLATGDLVPQFANLYPEILDPLVTDEEFRALIAGVNARLRRAFDPFGGRAWFDAVMGVLTGFAWEDLGLTGVKAGSAGVEALLERWNRGKREEGKEVQVVPVGRVGFTALDFVVPDPGIDGVGDAEDAEEEVEAAGGAGTVG